MTKWGGLAFGLMIGCATGVVVRDAVVMPARAQGNAESYQYRVYQWADLLAMGQQIDPKLDRHDAYVRAMNEIGKQGWRFVQTHDGSYIFEARAGQ